MKTPRSLILSALALLALVTTGCEDGPVQPGSGADLDAQTALALEQAVAQAETMIEPALVEMPEGRDEAERVRPEIARGPGGERRAALAVELAERSVAHAERLLEGTEPEDVQLRHLDRAREALRRAEAALEEGRPVAAAELARVARTAALMAVVLPRGVSPEEARAILDLAEELIEQARAALGPEASDLETHLLTLAGRLFDAGSQAVADGATRGVVLLWTSAALAAVLIG